MIFVAVGPLTHSALLQICREKIRVHCGFSPHYGQKRPAKCRVRSGEVQNFQKHGLRNGKGVLPKTSLPLNSDLTTWNDHLTTQPNDLKHSFHPMKSGYLTTLRIKTPEGVLTSSIWATSPAALTLTLSLGRGDAGGEQAGSLRYGRQDACATWDGECRGGICALRVPVPRACARPIPAERICCESFAAGRQMLLRPRRRAFDAGFLHSHGPLLCWSSPR